MQALLDFIDKKIGNIHLLRVTLLGYLAAALIGLLNSELASTITFYVIIFSMTFAVLSPVELSYKQIAFTRNYLLFYFAGALLSITPGFGMPGWLLSASNVALVVFYAYILYGDNENIKAAA